MGKWRCRKKFQAEEEKVGKPATCGVMGRGKQWERKLQQAMGEDHGGSAPRLESLYEERNLLANNTPPGFTMTRFNLQ